MTQKNTYNPLGRLGIDNAGEDLSAVPAGKVPVRLEDGTWNGIEPGTISDADMLKAVYDIDNNGIVDNSEKLGGQLPSHYHDVDNSVESLTRVFVSPAEKTAITHANRDALDDVSGVNTGDETNETIVTKLGTDLSNKLDFNGNGSSLTGLTKSQVGLGNVDNTSDLNKPISTATQNALNDKANDNAVVHLTGEESITGLKTFNAIQFNTLATEACQQGVASWDATSGTVKIGMIGGDVCLNLGQEMFIYAKNTSGAIITNGTPVYISGASGANIEIAKALASSQDNCRKTIAVATEDIGINEFGYVTTFGFVRDINTNGFIEGGEVFVGVSGGYTQTKPALPNCIVKIGICARANTSNGIILVNVDVKSTKDIQVDSGDLTVYTEANKTLVLQQQCYRDEYPTPLVPAGGAAAPDQVTYTIGGVSTTRYSFDGNTTEERISGSFEIPHDYKTGGTIEVHIHWLPTTNGTGAVQWHFDWCYMGVGVAPQAETTLSVIDTVSANQQYFHKIKAFGNLPANGYEIGDKILFTLRRTPNGASDTYGADAILEQIALHVPIDTLGSRQIYVK